MSIFNYPSQNGVLTSLIWRKTATGGETSLSGYDNASQALSYTPGQEQVYLNGILLVRGDDYTATNGTSITGLTALAASDYVQIVCYNNFSLASLPSTSISGTIANNQLQNSSITINGSAISLGGSVSSLATLTGSETLTNKTLNLTSNTLTGTTAQFNTALSDGDFATLAGSETLTNKTLTNVIYTQALLTPTFTTNAYTLVLGDQGDILLASNGATAGTINIPTNATVAFPTGTQITIIQTGSGQLTIQASTPATTTINSTGATATSPKLRAQNSSATLIKTATDTWYVVGDIS
jgi:hypothetical protein